MNKQFPRYRGVVVKKARNGYGVFATKLFKKGAVLFPIVGPLIEGNEDDDVDEVTQSNAYRYDEDSYITPKGTIPDFINHSCNPNAKVVKRDGELFLVAHKQIASGKEICFDYSTITAIDDVWTMKCRCGSRLCRGVVRRFQSLPKELKARYIKEEIVPSYILEI